MQKHFWSCLCGVLAVALSVPSLRAQQAAADPAAPPPAASLPTADARTLYTLGQLISRTLESFSLTEDELDYVRLGMEDGVLRRDPKVDLAAEAPRLHELQTARRHASL